MKKLKKLLLVVFLVGGFFLVPAKETFAQGENNCSIIGNNMAFYNQGSQDNSIFQEANYTLILLIRDWSNTQDVISAINKGKNVIIRLGANRRGFAGSTDVAGDAAREAAQYIEKIREISAATGNKPFIATAGHNEANCGEPIPFEIEKTFVQSVSSVSIPNVTWISGQVDFYCGIQKDEPPSVYISTFANMPGIQGISLPFYIGDVGQSKAETINSFEAGVAAANGKKIYVTESGPYKQGNATASKEEFLNYATAIKEIVAAGNLQSINLFNAFGINPDNNFSYTKPFWNFACREAFRTQCDNPEKVTQICLGSSSDKRAPYYVEPIAGIFDFANQDNPQRYRADNTAAKETFDKIYEDLVAQGYQAYCAMPDFKYMASSNINDFMAEQMIAGESVGNRVSVTMEDYKQFFNYIDAQTPIWRKKGIYVLKDKNSLEAFWTHKDELQKIGTTKIDYSPAFALASPKTQCREKTKILNAINKKCNNLSDPSTCALNIAFHPDSNIFKFKDLYDAMANPDNNFNCDLMDQNDSTLTSIQQKIKTSLMQMPFALPTAYRFAFAVYVADLKEPRTATEFDNFTQWSALEHPPGFDFLRFDPERKNDPTSLGSNTNQVAQPKHEIRILAFLVPDFGTNLDNIEFTYTPPPEVNFKDGQGPEEMVQTPVVSRNHLPSYGQNDKLNLNLDYKDALKIARDSFLKPKQIENNQKKWRERKEKVNFEMVGDGYNFNPNNEHKKLIECLYYNGQPALKKYRCEEPLTLALTTFINRRIENPEDCRQENIEYQKNNTIFDDAGIQLGESGLNQKYKYKGVNYDGNILKDGFYPQNVANVIPNSEDTTGSEPLRDREKNDAFRFLSHYVFTEFKDHSTVVTTPEPENGNFPYVYINGYLVYPQGYELESIEDTLLGVFLSPEQIAEFNEKEYEKYFKMDGIEDKFEIAVGKTGQKFWLSEELRDGQCLTDYEKSVSENTNPDPDYTFAMYANDNCKRAPEASVRQNDGTKDKSPRILGVRLGMITIKIQQVLRAITHPSWKYATSCLNSERPVEDFLLGRCNGKVEDYKNDEAIVESEYLKTEVAMCDKANNRQIYGNTTNYPMGKSDQKCSVANSITNQVENVSLYVPSIHNIPEWNNPNDRVNCDKIYGPLACVYGPGNNQFGETRDGDVPTLIAHKVDDSGNFTPSGNRTACEFIQDEATKNGISPRLALTFWIEESGASAFKKAYDFGVISQPKFRDFVDTSIPQLSNAYPGYNVYNQLGQRGDNHYGFVDFVLNNSSYLGLLLQYSGEAGRADLTPEFCLNPDFPARIKSVYEQLGNYK